MWKMHWIWRSQTAAGLAVLLASMFFEKSGEAQTNVLADSNSIIVVIKGTVEVSPGAPAGYSPARNNQVLHPGDRIRVGPLSEVAVRRSDQSVFRLAEKSDLLIKKPESASRPRSSFYLFSGILNFFHRDQPTQLEIESRTAVAAVRGTEFNMEVDEAGTTTVTVLDGVIDLINQRGFITLTNNQQGEAVSGQPPRLRPALDIMNVIQWTLYYPGILEISELPLDAQERTLLNASLAAWRSGNLVGALTSYPPGRQPASDAEKVYRAALLLAVGQVDDSGALLSSIPQGDAAQRTTISRLAAALEEMIAIVKLRPTSPAVQPDLATEWLVESYRLQFLGKLDEALAAARISVSKSADFGYAWERVAELEFSFGRIDHASEALEKALSLSSQNAQAVALNGFLFAARNKIQPAIREFNRAIALDGGLANGWLGRGLARIRSGDLEAGREDLLTAAALEPQRAFLRSYLAKAWSDDGQREHATHELDLAKELDSADPTAWLYSALLRQQYNEINDAIHDLEHSQDLGANRSVYRSGFLLDQDRAVRAANLAHIYRDAGMTDWSVLEAGRAVAHDYGNYSAHLFLANSYDELRDPNRISLRYETPAESEYLIANLLAPVGAGTLSQSISQSEYSKLFERNRLGFISHTEYLSRGAWYENGSQFGTFGNSSYSLEGVYRSDRGQRPNNDFEERELRLHFRQQLTQKDSIYLRVVDYESVGGDRFQYYDQNAFNPGLRVQEDQQPALVLGYHHEWNPGSHFIFAGARFDDTYQVNDPFGVIWKRFELFGELSSIVPMFVQYQIRTKLELYSAEAQQIWETPRNTAIFGGRYQSGDFQVRNLYFNPGAEVSIFPQPPTLPGAEPRFERWSVYGYDSFRLFDSLLLVGGIAYDRLTFPANFRSPPVVDEEDSLERFSPKAGFVWTPAESTILRGAYTRSPGGASLDQSVRLEPTQLAGFNQAFRSILPESIGGANVGARFTTWDASIEQRLGKATYLAAGAELLETRFSRVNGAYTQDPFLLGDLVAPSLLLEHVGYRERSLFFSINQLIGDEWALGARYRLTEARFHNSFPGVNYEILPDDIFRGDQKLRSALHQLDLRVVYNEKHGFFTQFDGLWNLQSNSGYSTDLPGDDFWQFDILAGYRFLRRRAQIAVGILNLADQDYHLNPLVLYNERPRERTFVTRLELSF